MGDTGQTCSECDLPVADLHARDVKLFGPWRAFWSGTVTFGCRQGLPEQRVDSVSRFPRLVMIIAINEDFIELVKDLVFVEMRRHFRDELADIMGTTGNKAFRRGDNGWIGFAQRVGEVEINKEGAVVGGGIFVEQVKASGL